MFDVELVMRGFHEELTKLALLPPSASRILMGSGSGMGLGALAGAAASGGASGHKAYEQARAQGATKGQAFLSGLGHGVTGALPGAAAGAVLGAAGGAGLAAGGKGRLLQAAADQQHGPLGVAARFGQRQVHALTGATPKGFLNPEGVRQMRGGAWGAENHIGKVESSALRQKAMAELELKHARNASQHAQTAETMGLTSLPGYARAMKEHGVGKTLLTGAKEQWHGTGAVGKALGFGVPAAAAAKELATPTQDGDQGRLRRAASHAEELAFSVGPLPIAGSMVLAGGLHKALGRKKPKSEVHASAQLDPAGGVAVPSEREASERYIGSNGGSV